MYTIGIACIVGSSLTLQVAITEKWLEQVQERLWNQFGHLLHCNKHTQ